MMVSLTDKLASASAKLEKPDCKLVDVSELLAAAGAEAKLVDKEVVEFIEITEEFECIETILTEFIEIEADGFLVSEEKAVEGILAHAAVADKVGSFQFESKFEVDVKSSRR